MLTGNITLISHYRLSKPRNIVIHGHLFGLQLYTDPLLLPNVPPNDTKATLRNLFQPA